MKSLICSPDLLGILNKKWTCVVYRFVLKCRFRMSLFSVFLYSISVSLSLSSLPLRKRNGAGLYCLIVYGFGLKCRFRILFEILTCSNALLYSKNYFRGMQGVPPNKWNIHHGSHRFVHCNVHPLVCQSVQRPSMC